MKNLLHCKFSKFSKFWKVRSSPKQLIHQKQMFRGNRWSWSQIKSRTPSIYLPKSLKTATLVAIKYFGNVVCSILKVNGKKEQHIFPKISTLYFKRGTKSQLLFLENLAPIFFFGNLLVFSILFDCCSL